MAISVRLEVIQRQTTVKLPLRDKTTATQVRTRRRAPLDPDCETTCQCLCAPFLQHEIHHGHVPDNDHSSSQPSAHKALTCPEGQSAWVFADSLFGESLASCKNSVCKCTCAGLEDLCLR